MHKRKLHHIWTKLRPINYWYFLTLSIISASVFVLAYRQTDVQMVRLRNEVFLADKQGQDIEKPLRELREYVYSHMGADLTKGDNAIKPPIQLKSTYERLMKAENERVASANQKVSDDATAICEQRFGAGQLRDGRVQCVQDYIMQNSVKPRLIPKELYQFDFVAPRWSPDLAGWSLVAAVVFFTLFIGRFVLEGWFKRRLK